ncbi:MAG: hypothetical protein AB7S72_15420 [Draconibacterium sp.]
MYLYEKHKKNADLVVPFVGCPIGEAVSDCPFIAYWTETDIEKRIRQMDKLSDEELSQLRVFHQRCLLKKLEQTAE